MQRWARMQIFIWLYLVQASPSVERLAFDEHRPHRVIGRLTCGRVALMQELDDGAIQASEEEVL
jgi:hypothetical protein